MNPGYLSYVLVCILFILLASGWKDILFHGISRTSILLFFVGWIPLSRVTAQAGGFHVRISAVFLLIAAMVCTWAMEGAMARVNVWCAGLLLGSFDFLMREMNGWSMLLQHFGAAINAAIVVAVLTMLLGRKPVWQFVAVTVGLLSAECVYIWIHRADSGRILGGASFSDRWWLTLCAARVLSVALENMFRVTTASFKHWMDSRKEWGE
jgi:hypothetical protein